MEDLIKLDQNSYLNEYNDVIAKISEICSVIMSNKKNFRTVT